MERHDNSIDPQQETGKQPTESVIPIKLGVETVPIDKSNYWQNPDGSIRKEILEKARQILRGQY